jgi:IS30 family transposase
MKKLQGKFKHLSYVKRLCLEQYIKQGLPKKTIAKMLGVHISTVYRELKRGEYVHRNTDWTTSLRYAAELADNKYRCNLKAKGAPIKLGNDHAFATYVENLIVNKKYSPAAVLGEIKRKHLIFSTSICLRTLYSYIEKGVFLNLTMKNCPLRGKQKRHCRKIKAAKAPRGTSIELRPLEISNRSTFGHWELDFVEGPTTDSLLVFTERLTRKELVLKVPDKTCASVVKSLNILERKYGSLFYKVFKTITVDNGSGFSDCVGMEKSRYGKQRRLKMYYCHPYSSYERGSNERMNREIRRWFPKGTDFSKISSERVAMVENWINNYPRAIFSFDTSDNLFNIELEKLSM